MDEINALPQGSDTREAIDRVLGQFAAPVEGEFQHAPIIRETFDDQNPVAIVQNLKQEASDFSKRSVS